MANIKKVLQKVKKGIQRHPVGKVLRGIKRISPSGLFVSDKERRELDQKVLGAVSKGAKATARLGRLHPVAQAALTGIAGLTGKGRGARIIPPGALGPMAGRASLKPKKKLASKGTRGLPEQQEARRRKVAQKAKTRTRKSY
jgi:hypothetical protein